MADPMKIRATLTGDSTEVKVLMSHEMETGQRKDAQGNNVYEEFVVEVHWVTHERATALDPPPRQPGERERDHLVGEPLLEERARLG